MSATPLLKTPLHALHLELGAKMVAFAGYDMPVAYPAGIIAEHRHCRSAAALFDVSHMGQAELFGEGAGRALETLVPMDVVVVSMSWPYRHNPASSRRVSRAPRPAGFTSGCASSARASCSACEAGTEISKPSSPV